MRMLFVLLAGLLLTAPAGAEEERWQSELTTQIYELHACQVGFLSDVLERRVDGTLVISARVHCEDGRQFDASRHGERGLFTFTACEERKVC